MTEETFYRKDENGEFVPVLQYDSDLTSSLPYGAHLIRVRPGVRSTTQHIDPDNAAVIAALENAKDAIVSEIVSASQARPSRVPLTQMQIEAWDNMKEAFGDDISQLNYPSANEIVQSVISELEFLIDEMMTNDSVKKAYDNFVLMVKLSGKKQNDLVK